MVSQNEKETLSEKKKKRAVQWNKKNGRLNGRLPDRIILLFLRLLKKIYSRPICWKCVLFRGKSGNAERIKWSGPG